MEELLQHKELLLREMQHRVANSLQIIAGILLIKARTVGSEETRQHLHDAYQRVMSVADEVVMRSCFRVGLRREKLFSESSSTLGFAGV